VRQIRHARPATNYAVRLSTGRRTRLIAAYSIFASAIATSALPSGVHAQSNAGGRSEVFAGSTFESYLRYLQSLGKSDPYPVGIRGFSPLEIDKMAAKDSAHPWAHRYSFQKQNRDAMAFTLDAVRPTVGLTVNSSYPFGGNDGVVWAGKGLTSVAQIGVAARWGPFSATLAPIAFRAQNADFDMADNGQAGRLRFNDAQYSVAIDKPQRFGDTPYGRVDWGESTLRADVLWLTAGISSASQWWGPTNDFPYVLGNNSGGFPHVFFGTSKPVDAAIVNIHGRVVYGMLDQSPYSPVGGTDYFSSFSQPGKRRFMAGAIGLMQVHGAPGLEIGGTRFFHAANSRDGITGHNLGLPFQNLFRNKLREEADTIFGGSKSVRENQLASLFIRWAPPGSGFDVYGEYGREDFSADVRDLLLEPEHSATTNLGVRKAWMTGLNLNAVRVEGFSYEASAGSRTRGEGQIYLHGVLLQGHTNRGQALGAPTGAGSGSAQTVAYDRFTPGGRMNAFFSRVTQREQLGVMRGAIEPVNHAVDVMNSIGGELTRFVGPFDIGARLVLTKDINRNFLGDRSNVTLGFNVRQEF